MILSRFVKIQLMIFSVLTVVGVLVMGIVYIQIPSYLGIGSYRVTLDLPHAGGVYPFANVTYRGDQVGRVTDVRLEGDAVKATLTLDSDTKIPADLDAKVLSVSAVGEQYVDLLPRRDSGPYLGEGAVIPEARATVPQEVGPLLDRLDSAVSAIPKDQFNTMLDEAFVAFNGAGQDLGSIIASSTVLANDLGRNADAIDGLIRKSNPLLRTQTEGANDITAWVRGLSAITGTIADNDAELSRILVDGKGFADSLTETFDDLAPVAPLLLHNLTSTGELLVTYNKSLEQVILLLPPVMAQAQSLGPLLNDANMNLGDFDLQLNDPPGCTVGFLPASQRRSPDLTDSPESPTGMYCKLAEDSPVNVRGARNFPCIREPGKRAPTAEICKSDEEYDPLIDTEPYVGPNPADPNLQRQGVPGADGLPDTRRAPGAPSAEPSTYGTTYDPQSGKYVGSDGKVYRQANVDDATGPTSWMDLMAK